ncbi:MAG TPA: DUF2188 domain-containing protein [Puia sp.]|nr:DUF2188 domain-containing protein [Puia sp.]
MSKKNQHVVPLGNGLAVKAEGNDRFTVITETQKEAVNIAKEIARNNESAVIIHGKDGKIKNSNSYANGAG